MSYTFRSRIQLSKREAVCRPLDWIEIIRGGTARTGCQRDFSSFSPVKPIPNSLIMDGVKVWVQLITALLVKYL
jgi:hypothetical protein